MALTTTQAWKTWRRIDGTEYDGVVGSLVSVVTSEITRYVGRAIEETDYADYAVSGNDTQTIVLRHWPVTALTAVKYRSDDGSTTTLDASAYRCLTGDENRGEVYRLPYRPMSHLRGAYVDEWGTHTGYGSRPIWRKGFGNYLFTFTAGYATVPEDIQKAAWHLIDTYLDRQGIDIFAQAIAEGNENRTARTAEDAKAEYHRLLAPFRRLP